MQYTKHSPHSSAQPELNEMMAHILIEVVCTTCACENTKLNVYEHKIRKRGMVSKWSEVKMENEKEQRQSRNQWKRG